jgi:hypothetical protein
MLPASVHGVDSPLFNWYDVPRIPPNSFRKRTSFPQFVADLISFQCEFLAGNFDKLIAMADELKILTTQDKDNFFHKAHALLMVNLLMSCRQHFSAHISQEEVGKGVGFLYEKYLTEVKRQPKAEVDGKMEDVLALIDLVSRAEESYCRRQAHCRDSGDTSVPKIDDPVKAAQLHLCQGFAEYCAGPDMKTDVWQGRRFAAFKLAMGLVAGDIVGNALAQYRVTF